MVIFGGYDNESPGAFHVTNDTAAYSPSTNRWQLLPPAPLSPRAGALALWTGKSVIVLGGRPAVSTASVRNYGDAAVFSPSTGSWQHVAAPSPPRGHQLAWQSLVWADNELLAFSFWSTSRPLGHGGYEASGGTDLFSYDLGSRHWRTVGSRPDAVPGVEEALSTGQQVLVRGAPYNCGGCPGPFTPEITDLYNPAQNSWTRIPPDPLGSDNLTSAWTGNALFSFNPSSEIGQVRPGAASLYDPATGHWRLLPTAPFGCGGDEPVTWTGHQILVYCPQFGDPRGARVGLIFTPSQSGTVGASVNITIELDRTQVTAGTPIHGQAFVTNTTGKPIALDACAADGWLFVGLTNAHVAFEPAVTVPTCPADRLLPGLNRFPITVSTSYQSCTQSSAQASVQRPACNHSGPPALPPGRYVTKVITLGLPGTTQLPPPIRVTLSGASS